MAQQIDHECPECGHENYKIVPELTEFLGTTDDVDDPPSDGVKEMPVACQRHGCDAQYHIYLRT